ncbi:MAG: response regulator [Methylocystaceae bacterium]|nr:response regulator [Methylocystaceae bacterium]
MPDNVNILLVDDEENILSSLKRSLRGSFHVTTAKSGAEALNLAAEHDPPFAVVVSDMRMPEMNGVETLEQFAKVSPDTVRIMLTGNAEQQTAIDAINTGKIFRFLNKPCDSAVLSQAIQDGIHQHKLLVSEKTLLENTLSGSIKLLSDMAYMIAPLHSFHTEVLRRWAKELGFQLGFKNQWELDFAIMLSQIGRVSIPAETLTRISQNEKLTDLEQSIVKAIPEVGCNLLSNIPRMQNVAKIILYQDKNYDGSGFPADDVKEDDIPYFARILHVLKELGSITNGNEPSLSVIAEFEKHPDIFDHNIVAAVHKYIAHHPDDLEKASARKIMETCGLFSIKAGGVLQSDLYYEDGRLLLAKGNTLSSSLLAKLKSISRVHKIQEPIHVLYR